MGLFSPKHTQDELSGMTIAQIKALAADEGIAITKTKKADIISEFMEAM